MPNKITCDRFVAVFDILGFKNHLFVQGLDETIHLCRDLLLQTEWSTRLPVASLSPGGGGSVDVVRLPFQLASDSILIWTDREDPETGQDFFHACGILVAQGVERGVPLRGAIAYGPTHIDRENSIFVGTPLVTAFSLEKAQTWLGCGVHDTALSAHLSLTKVLFEQADIVEYAVPAKLCARVGRLRSHLPKVALRWTEHTTSESRLDRMHEAAPDRRAKKYIDRARKFAREMRERGHQA